MQNYPQTFQSSITYSDHTLTAASASRPRDYFTQRSAHSIYALIPEETYTSQLWKLSIIQKWAQVKIGFSVVLAAVAVAFFTVWSNPSAAVGMVTVALASFAFAMLAYYIAGLSFEQSAALLLLFSDGCIVVLAELLAGPHMTFFILVAGSCILGTVLGSFVATVLFGAGVTGFILIWTILVQLGKAQPMLRVSAGSQMWVVAIAGIAGVAFLFASAAMLRQKLKASLADAAAMQHEYDGLERRSRNRRAVFDADSIALQTALSRAMRGESVPQTAACEELAPLSSMVNSTAQRIPALLRDREERLRMEKAIRDLVGALEKAWAGFEWQWPARSGTAIDLIVEALRPKTQEFTGN